MFFDVFRCFSMFGDVFRCLTDFGVDVLRTLGSMFDGLLGRCFSMFFDVFRCLAMFFDV